MTAERRRAATLDRVQHLQVLPVKAAQAVVDESRSSGPDDVGHLQGRPVHGLTLANSNLTQVHPMGSLFPADVVAIGAGKCWWLSGRCAPAALEWYGCRCPPPIGAWQSS